MAVRSDRVERVPGCWFVEGSRMLHEAGAAIHGRDVVVNDPERLGAISGVAEP